MASGGRMEENTSVGSQDMSVSNFLPAYLDGCLQDYDYDTVNSEAWISREQHFALVHHKSEWSVMVIILELCGNV